MIKNHPFYPKKAVDQYQLQCKMPDFLVHEAKGFQLKNHQYYHDNYNIWNNPHQANKKNYLAFHKKNAEAMSTIEQRKQDHENNQRMTQMERNQIFSQERVKQLERLHERKQERICLQLESQQPNIQMIEVGDVGFLHRTLNNRSNSVLNGRADFLWNKINKLSTKQIMQSIPPKIIEMEDNAVKLIAEKLNQDRIVEGMKEDLIQANIQRIRGLFQRQHNRNMEREQSLGLVPAQKPKIEMSRMKVKTASKAGSRNHSIDAGETKFDRYYHVKLNTNRPEQNQYTNGDITEFTQKFVDVTTFSRAQQNVTNAEINRLSKPKKQSKSLSLAKNPLDRTEFKGLLVQEVDSITANLRTNFNRAMMESSEVVKEVISRPHTNHTVQKLRFRHKRSQESRRDSEDVEILKDLDDFKRQITDRKIGFPNAQLILMKQPQNQTSTD